jgi:uncharacterized Ntn-hydrolase superfamily protein
LTLRFGRASVAATGSGRSIMRRRRLLLFAVFLAASPARATFSIVAFDARTGELGVAVQSRAFSVGGGVPWAEAGVGAIATQASTNESFGPRGLELLRSGLSAQQALDRLIADDEGRDQRQLAIVDARGNVANWTGSACLDWAGHLQGPGLSVQGNILASAEVVAAMRRAFAAPAGELSERLLAALHAAQAAGGDKRGMQSAALLVVRPSRHFPEYRTRYVDLRVEDHATPIVELERVFRIHQASDLLRAHVRYAEEFDAAGDSAAAKAERAQIGAALDFALAQPDATSGTLNALAWYCATGNTQLDRALVAAERASALAPQDAGILDTLAEVQFRLGRREAALQTIERALALDPKSDYLLGQKARFSSSGS